MMVVLQFSCNFDVVVREGKQSVYLLCHLGVSLHPRFLKMRLTKLGLRSSFDPMCSLFYCIAMPYMEITEYIRNASRFEGSWVLLQCNS